jgi:hypothetical protein
MDAGFFAYAFGAAFRARFSGNSFAAGEYDVAEARSRAAEFHFECAAPTGAIQNKEETHGRQESFKEIEEVQETQRHEDPDRTYVEEVTIRRH